MHSRDWQRPSVVILVADGARPDTLAGAIDAGHLPALARLRAEGGLHTVTSVFPSVTGPAYTPFLMGRFPGPIGLPALRWFDRARETRSFPHWTRSYVGINGLSIDRDVDPSAPTLFELSGSNAAALSVFTRGLAKGELVSGSPAFFLRAAATHFRGDVAGWHKIDRKMGARLVERIRRHKPRVAFGAFTGTDKSSHADGHDAPSVVSALKVVDDAAARIRTDAEADGRWESMHLWIVSDHGHSRVTQHEDLARIVASWSHRVRAHPWVYGRAPDVAVMVSGNAMAHLYVGLGDKPRRKRRAPWSENSRRWEPLAEQLLALDSVDLLLIPLDDRHCEIRTRHRGTALVTEAAGRYSYFPVTGDPFGIGEHHSLSADEAHEVTRDSDYPDAIVQIATVAQTPRAGEIVLSAARDWDFRARYEPIPHVSSHGALHREHMLVPLLLNRPVAAPPRRNTDVFASALKVLGLPAPKQLDGASFV